MDRHNGIRPASVCAVHGAELNRPTVSVWRAVVETAINAPANDDNDACTGVRPSGLYFDYVYV